MRFHLCILDLSITELLLIQRTAAALADTEKGLYLPAIRWATAARSLIARGFLTEVPAVLSPGWPDWIAQDWIMVCLTQANLAAMEVAAQTAMASRPEYPLLLEEVA